MLSDRHISVTSCPPCGPLLLSFWHLVSAEFRSTAETCMPLDEQDREVGMVNYLVGVPYHTMVHITPQIRVANIRKSERMYTHSVFSLINS